MYERSSTRKSQSPFVLLRIALAFIIAIASPVVVAEPPADARIISQSSGYKHSSGVRSGQVVTIGRSANITTSPSIGTVKGLNDISASTLSYLANQKRQDIQRKRIAEAERRLMQQQLEAMNNSNNSRSYRRSANTMIHPNNQQSLPNGIIDTTTGTYMPRAGNGYVDPRNGTFMHDVGAGVVDTRTGEFIIKH